MTSSGVLAMEPICINSVHLGTLHSAICKVEAIKESEFVKHELSLLGWSGTYTKLQEGP
jgi:hypothetical protein